MNAKAVERLENWSHPSVVALASDGADPATTIITRARRMVLKAISEGWSGPPFDPASLASMLGIPTHPRADIADAILMSGDGGKTCIEFNPNRPRARVRFSIAHEIAHTLFDDFRQTVQHRWDKGDIDSEAWELELLCNIAAAEILMPLGA